MTVEQAVKRVLGNATFDYALPQPWVEHVHSLVGDELGDERWKISHQFVWAYDDAGGFCGRPCALTVDANRILARVNLLDGSHYPLTENPVDPEEEEEE